MPISKWLFTLIFGLSAALLLTGLTGCQLLKKEPTPEEQALIEDAQVTVELSFDYRQDQDIADDDLEVLQELYHLKTLESNASKGWIDAFDQKVLTQAQEKTGGIQEVSFEDASVGQERFGGQMLGFCWGKNVRLTYRLSGPKGSVREGFRLYRADVALNEEHSESSSDCAKRLLDLNDDQFVIVAHWLE